jgi:hypothetical protein
MIAICYILIWSLFTGITALWIWKKIQSNLKVHLMFLVSCVYFAGIFGGYGLL